MLAAITVTRAATAGDAVTPGARAGPDCLGQLGLLLMHCRDQLAILAAFTSIVLTYGALGLLLGVPVKTTWKASS